MQSRDKNQIFVIVWISKENVPKFRIEKHSAAPMLRHEPIVRATERVDYEFYLPRHTVKEYLITLLDTSPDG